MSDSHLLLSWAGSGWCDMAPDIGQTQLRRESRAAVLPSPLVLLDNNFDTFGIFRQSRTLHEFPKSISDAQSFTFSNPPKVYPQPPPPNKTCGAEAIVAKRYICN